MNPETGRYSRHKAFISSIEQEKLHYAKILIAGCGAGSSIAAHLARLGIGTRGEIVCADPDMVEINNLNRQAYFESHVGDYKARALVDVIHRINSDVNVIAVLDGITDSNIEMLVKNSHIVVEMVDIAAPDVTFAIHEAAVEYKKPLVTGMDVGEGITVSVFDYRSSYQMSYREYLGINGNITKEDMKDLSALGLTIQSLIGPVGQQFQTAKEAKSYYETIFELKSAEIFKKLPREMHSAAQQLIKNQLNYIPQSGLAAGLLGVVEAAIVKDIIIGKKVKTAPDSIQLNVTDFVVKQ